MVFKAEELARHTCSAKGSTVGDIHQDLVTAIRRAGAYVTSGETSSPDGLRTLTLSPTWGKTSL